ncbi:unnamed protein product [Paramecium octaurelia]|uniref:Transmembrane protein n=1 Tax=Paramecium octaurelia TaxID=43137 RepID=A0A8S1UN02_PAROT|nr:unnamed protein product [Paramecium octaurelia]
MIFLSCLFITLYGQALYPFYNVYLTQGETYSLPLKELFKEQILNFTIQDCPDNVQLFNALNLLSEQNNNETFISISSSFPYYLLITQNNGLNLYYWNQTYLNLINQMVLPQQKCLNALLTQENSIIIDCYNLTNLNIYNYQENAWTIVYSELIQQMPKNTDFKTFTSNSINFILYAQYYDDYEILTQFQFNQNLFQNISIWIQPFIDFIVSNKSYSQNAIYLWNDSTLYQLNANQQGLNLQTYIFQYVEILAVQILYPQKMFYQCDTLLIIFIEQIITSQICYNSQGQNSIASKMLLYLNQISSAYLSDEFLILQQFDIIEIYEMKILDENIKLKLIGGLKLNSPFSQVSFDYNSNQLFIFSDTQIVTYLVDYPNINFKSIQKQQNYQFIIQGSPYLINYTDAYKCSNCTVQLNVSVLSINDDNIYLTREISNQNVYTFSSQHWLQFFLQFSGSLITANFSVEKSNLGNFYDTTLFKVCFINQSFQNLQILSKNYAVGIINNNNNSNIVLINQWNKCHYQRLQNFTISSKINIKNNQIQGYQLDQGQLFFGIQINSKQLYINNNSYYNQKGPQILNFQPFQQFYMLYQQILNWRLHKFINEQQYKSSWYSIKLTIMFINFIYQQRLSQHYCWLNNIIKYLYYIQLNRGLNQSQGYENCKQSVDIKLLLLIELIYLFQIWNVANLNSPYFEKNLRSIQNSNNIQLFADNLFYYVQTNKQIYVYNPVILEHSSLFYTFQYNGSYFSSTTIQDMALISFNSQFYLLNPSLVYSYQNTIQNTITNDVSLWYNTYNASVSSQIGTQNVIDYPPNQKIIIFNDFLNISLNKKQYHVQTNNVTLTQDNITFSGQVGWFQIQCNGKSKVQVINTLNPVGLAENVIAVFNQQILVMYGISQLSFQILNITSQGKLKKVSPQQNFSQNCSKEFAQMNAYYIFLFCHDYNSQHYYDLFRIQILNQSFGEMTYLTKIYRYFVQNTILLDDILYIYYSYNITIYDINLNISHSIQTKCNMISFQPFVYKNSNYSFYAYIYICKDDKKLFYQLGNRYLQEQIQFTSVQYIQIKDYFYLDLYIVGILIVSQQQYQFAIMCFTNQFSFIISLNYTINETNFSQSTLLFKRLLFYSPTQTANILSYFKSAVISSGLVCVWYQSYWGNLGYYSYFVLYNVSNLQFIQGNLENPILPSGIFSMQYQLGQYQYRILTFNSSYGFIFNLQYPNYLISSLEIKIYFSGNTNQCNLTAYNLVNNVTANYTFKFDEQINFGFEFALLSLLIIVFISAVVYLWFKTKDQKEQFGLEEFEGLEIDTFQ